MLWSGECLQRAISASATSWQTPQSRCELLVLPAAVTQLLEGEESGIPVAVGAAGQVQVLVLSPLLVSSLVDREPLLHGSVGHSLLNGPLTDTFSSTCKA